LRRPRAFYRAEILALRLSFRPVKQLGICRLFLFPAARTASKIEGKNGVLWFSPGRRRADIRMSKRISNQSTPRAAKRASERAPEAAVKPAPQSTPLAGAPAASTAAQFKKLVEVISRSQLNYRDLIDSLDHAVFTISLEGEIRVANRRLEGILEAAFADLIGHRLDEFLSEPTVEQAAAAMPNITATGQWQGRVQVRFKRDQQLRYYDCWLQLVR